MPLCDSLPGIAGTCLAENLGLRRSLRIELPKKFAFAVGRDQQQTFPHFEQYLMTWIVRHGKDDPAITSPHPPVSLEWPAYCDDSYGIGPGDSFVGKV